MDQNVEGYLLFSYVGSLFSSMLVTSFSYEYGWSYVGIGVECSCIHFVHRVICRDIKHCSSLGKFERHTVHGSECGGLPFIFIRGWNCQVHSCHIILLQR